MTVVPEEGFELNGVAFGENPFLPIVVSSFDPGSRTFRAQDTDAPYDDVRHFGRDYRAPSTWSWELYLNRETYTEALETLSALENAWDDAATRATPQAVTALRYRLDGRTRVVYGRPRNFAAPLDVLRKRGRVQVTCDFVRSDTLHYDDVESSIELAVGEAAIGELTVPFTTPFSTLVEPAPIPVDAVVAGTTETWPVIHIEAPTGIYNMRLQFGELWGVGIAGDLPPGSVVDIDARPWARSALLNGQAGGLNFTRYTSLSAMGMPPGTHEVNFTGSDLAGTATCVLSWRDASKTI